RNLRGVTCELEAVGEVVAGRAALLKGRLENRRGAATAQGVFFFHQGLPRPPLVDPLKARERPGALGRGGLPPRGGLRPAHAGVLSRFPLGLFRKYRHAKLSQEIVVFPSPEASAVPQVPPEDARGGRPHPRRRGGGSDIRMLRDFVAGDDPRDLHWKQSARM